jgi:hypothetical protein
MEAFEKLAEAKYFLIKMKESIDNIAYFKFNLSAFLTSSQSVTDYLKNEFAHNLKFKEWYPKKLDEMRNDPVFKFFNKKRNARNIVVHLKMIELRGRHEVTLTETIGPPSDSLTFELRAENGNIIQTGTSTSEPKTSPQEKTDEPKITHKWFFTDFNETEIIPLCSKYIESLQTIVDESLKNI